eukprot:SAG11_NODE_858_length_6850_cov_11.886535_4_plen_68_part_00
MSATKPSRQREVFAGKGDEDLEGGFVDEEHERKRKRKFSFEKPGGTQLEAKFLRNNHYATVVPITYA